MYLIDLWPGCRAALQRIGAGPALGHVWVRNERIKLARWLR